MREKLQLPTIFTSTGIETSASVCALIGSGTHNLLVHRTWLQPAEPLGWPGLYYRLYPFTHLWVDRFFHMLTIVNNASLNGRIGHIYLF